VETLIHIKVSGTPREIGFQQGQVMADRIQSAWEFYSGKLFGGQTAFIEAYGKKYLTAIGEFSRGYAEEIDAMADGAKMQPWQIAAMNALTELFRRLLEGVSVNECTAAYFSERRVLGQNWDWMEELEPLVVVLEIEREDGHRILQMTEPGIIGKIGLNSKGIGVCLNILMGGASPVSVPVHILLRSVLDGEDLDTIYGTFTRITHGTYSNILAADEKGKYINMEFSGTKMAAVNYASRIPLHTNHFLGEEGKVLNSGRDLLNENSLIRYDRGRRLIDDMGRTPGVPELKSVLMDAENGGSSICVEYKPLFGLNVGTVSSVIMDLPGKTMHVTCGNPRKSSYNVFSL
jgi:isopenicillin-N N-acyltransferase-like protein